MLQISNITSSKLNFTSSLINKSSIFVKHLLQYKVGNCNFGEKQKEININTIE